MKTIALFGITGRTGKPLYTLLLGKGYAVKALVRTPAKVQKQHAHLTLVEGNILSASDVDRTIEGADAVISVIGHVRGDKQALSIQTDGTRNILAAMQKHNVKRLISLTGGAVPYSKDKPKIADKLFSAVMNLVAKDILSDAIAHADLIAKSGTEWTVVRGPRLLDKPPVGTYRVGWVGVNASTSITYSDLAQYLVDELETGKDIGTMPLISH